MEENRLKNISKRELIKLAEQYYSQLKGSEYEIKPSDLRAFLIEQMGFSRATAYRIQRANQDQIFQQGRKDRKARNEEHFTKEEQREIFDSVYNYLYSHNLRSDDRVTLSTISEIARNANVSERYVACVVFGIDTEELDKINAGRQLSTRISVGLGFYDSELAKRVEGLKNELIANHMGDSFSIEDLKRLASSRQIPVSVIIRKVFNMSASQYKNLVRSGKTKFNDETYFFDYPHNSERKLEIELDKVTYIFENYLGSPKEAVFNESDKEDSLFEDESFYVLEATTKEEFDKIVLEKRSYLKEKYKKMEAKYEGKLDKILIQIKNLELKKDDNGNLNRSSYNQLKDYTDQLGKILIRIPSCYANGDPAKFNIMVAYGMLRQRGINEVKILAMALEIHEHDFKKRVLDNSSGKMILSFDNKVNLPKCPALLEFYKDTIDRASRMGVKSAGGTRIDVEDATDFVYEVLMNKGSRSVLHGRILEFANNEEREEEITDVIGMAACSIAKKKTQIIHMQQNETMSLDMQISSHNSKQESGSKTFGDSVPTIEIGYDRVIQETENPEEKILTAIASDESKKLVRLMMHAFEKFQDREKALTVVAKKIGISVDDLETKLAETRKNMKNGGGRDGDD